jgi:4-methyl-5(b-hydroxyethyl)-thiazole monophosphate biosynthesis
MKTVLVPLAQGCEELEAVTIIDILRRAEINVVTAGLDAEPVIASRGVKLLPDTTLDAVLKQDFDMMVLPGGLPGADHLNADARIHQLLQQLVTAGKPVAAICASPRILADAGLLKNKRITHYPTALTPLQLEATEVHLEQAVVRDGQVITSRGPGTAMDFALELVEVLAGKTIRDQVESDLVRTI